MAKIFFSVRVSENFFTAQEIKRIEDELKLYNSKSEFIRQILKEYFQDNKEKIPLPKKDTDNNQQLNHNQLQELKDLVKKNHLLLKNLNQGNFKFNTKQDTTYHEEEQELKREQVLNLMNQF